jgi:hypothetical protein
MFVCSIWRFARPVGSRVDECLPAYPAIFHQTGTSILLACVSPVLYCTVMCSGVCTKGLLRTWTVGDHSVHFGAFGSFFAGRLRCEVPCAVSLLLICGLAAAAVPESSCILAAKIINCCMLECQQGDGVEVLRAFGSIVVLRKVVEVLRY